MVENTLPTLSFGADGRASGDGSCNHFGGTYEAKDGKLTFGALSSTMMACLEPGVMEQETAYLNALTRVVRYHISGNRLTLFDADGLVIAEFVK